ncbi:MAG: hypothetical protein RLZZ211_2103 [Bacteroidota bacterium]
MQGLVLKSTGKWYQVLLEDGQIVQASIRGKLRLEGLKTTNPIAAGDRVVIESGSNESQPQQANANFSSQHRPRLFGGDA